MKTKRQHDQEILQRILCGFIALAMLGGTVLFAYGAVMTSHPNASALFAGVSYIMACTCAGAIYFAVKAGS